MRPSAVYVRVYNVSIYYHVNIPFIRLASCKNDKLFAINYRFYKNENSANFSCMSVTASVRYVSSTPVVQQYLPLVAAQADRRIRLEMGHKHLALVAVLTMHAVTSLLYMFQ